MRMKRTLSLTLGIIFLACTLPAGLSAQTAETAPDPLAGLNAVLGGASLNFQTDVYYGYNANNPASGNTFVQPFESHTNSFGLNLVQLQLDKPVSLESPLGYRATLAFGDAMTVVQNTAVLDGLISSTQYLKEGYLSYMAPIGNGLQFDVGKWVTPAGFEVIETSGNWNYSRGAVFYNAIPFYHFGVRTSYTVNDKWSFNGYVSNGWNNVESNFGGPLIGGTNRSGKTGGFSVHYTPVKQVGVNLTYLAGPQAFNATKSDWNNLVDLVVTIDPTEKLSLAAEYDFNNYRLSGSPDVNYTATAAFAKYQFNPKWAVAGRYEYINNHGGALALSPHYQTFTGSVERKLAGHLLTRLEYRHDIASAPFFEDHSNGFTATDEDTVKLGMVLVMGE